MRPVVVIAGPGPRVEAFQGALAALDLPPARVIDWAALAETPEMPLPSHAVVRLDSPGKTWLTQAALLRRGAQDEAAPRLPLDRLDDPAVARAYHGGHLLAPRQAARGMAALAGHLTDRFTARPDLWALHDPAAIAILGDKPACRKILAENGIPVPSGLVPLRGFDHLCDLMTAGRRRLFVKLDHGANGAGMVAVSDADGQLQALTTAVAVDGPLGPGLANTRAVQHHTSAATLAPVIDRLAAEGAHAETWMAKASRHGCPWDLRVLTLAGQPAHVVVRFSESPFTNLHLLNRRGEAGQVRAMVSDTAWAEMLDTARRVAGLFPACLCLGLDIAFSADRRRHWVLEVNAFGDHLKGALWQGLDPQQAILRHVLGATEGAAA